MRWTTDAHDERVVGAIEPLGFRAVASAVDAAGATCLPGRAGARCDATRCLGVVDELGGEGREASGTIRSQVAHDAYGPLSRCGWRIDARGHHVVLDVGRLGLERVYDVVRIYRGVEAPEGFSAVGVARAPVYEFRGGRPPSVPLVIEGDVFVTFETDGIGHAPRDGGAAGLQISWRCLENNGFLCPDAAFCGNGECVDGSCVCDEGYFGETCALDACQGAQPPLAAPAGVISSGAADDYPPARFSVFPRQAAVALSPTRPN